MTSALVDFHARNPTVTRSGIMVQLSRKMKAGAQAALCYEIVWAVRLCLILGTSG